MTTQNNALKIGTLDDILALEVSGALAPKLYQGLPIDVYHHAKAPGLSSTYLKNVVKHSHGHAEYFKANPTDSPSMALGRALHCAVLEPKLFAAQYVVCPEGMIRNASHKKYQEFLSQNEGKTVLTRDEMISIEGMSHNIRSHKDYDALFSGSIEEVSGFWNDPETGLLLKLRADLLTPCGSIVDVKTTRNPSPNDFYKSIYDLSYHMSAAMYLSGLKAITGKAETFYIVAVENVAPFKCVFYELTPPMIERGMELFRQALTVVDQAKQTNKVQFYPEGIVPLTLPLWDRSE